MTSNRVYYDASDRPQTGRPVVYATQGLISSGHYLTSMAGMRMLLRGGNAFDALVAAGFAAAVIEPIASYSLACEGVFMLYHPASGDLLSLNGQGTAPGRATIDFYKSQGLDSIPTGPGRQAHLSFTVPGVVDAYMALLERYGTKTLGEVMEPSIHYAERGVPFYEYLVKALDSPATVEQFDNYPPGGMDVFYNNRELPAPGSLLVQNGLAGTMKAMVAAETAAAGHRLTGLRAARDSFYKGEIARTIVESSRSVGGLLELDDLAQYSARFEKPVSTTYKGHQILCQPSNTQAPVLLQALNILESFDLRAMGHNSPRYIHTVAEALKLALADREGLLWRPGIRDGAHRRSAVQGVWLCSRRADRRRARPSGATRPGRPVHLFEGGRRRHTGQRPGGRLRRWGLKFRPGDHAYRRAGPRREHGMRNAQRRRLRQVGLLPAARLRLEHPH